MVKQYSDGYFINGEWYEGEFENNLPPTAELQLATYVSNCCSFADDIAYVNSRVYDEPVMIDYLQYLIMGLSILLIIAIGFFAAMILFS